MDAYDAMISDLKVLERARPIRGVFGAELHRYRRNPPLSEATVKAFETRYGIELPGEYREFLLRVANGGAGPFYGLLPLGHHFDLREIRPWGESIGDLAAAFPHTDPWNDLSGEPTDADAQDLPRYDVLQERFMNHYFDRRWVHGAIPIADRGCGLQVCLVVAGPERGNIWHDDRAGYKGIYPFCYRNSTRMAFLAWYRGWLDEVLALL